MKKLYTEPQLELMNIRLLADVLGPSMMQKETETPVDDENTGYFEPTNWKDPEVPEV